MIRKRLIGFLLAALGCAACSKEHVPAEDRTDTHEPQLIARGMTLDGMTSLPVRGIQVQLLARADGEVIQKDIAYTTSEGLFEVSLGNVDASLEYLLQAQDVDGLDNGGSFATTEIVINISTNSPSYRPDTRSYVLDGNVFYLSRE